MRQKSRDQSLEVHLDYNFREKFVETTDSYAMEMTKRQASINVYKPLNADNISFGLHMFQIFIKMHKRRLVIECFMRLKLVYSISMINRKRLNSSSSSKSSNLKESHVSKRQNRPGGLLNSYAQQSPTELGTSRTKLLNSIVNKLHETTNLKVETERESALAQTRIADQAVSSKLDSLEKILTDIKKYNEQSTRLPNSYAKKRAKAKGESPKCSAEHIVKPTSAFTLGASQSEQVAETKVDQNLENKQQRTLPYKIVNSPAEQRDEKSEIGNAKKLETIVETDNISFKRESRLMDELNHISSELNELRRINEEYITKNTVMLKNQTHVIQYSDRNQQETKWLKTQRPIQSRVDMPKILPDMRGYLPVPIVRQQQSKVQPVQRQQLRLPYNPNHQSNLTIPRYHEVQQPHPRFVTAFEKIKSRSDCVKPNSSGHFSNPTYGINPPPKGIPEMPQKPSFRPNITFTISGKPLQQPPQYRQYNRYVQPTRSPRKRHDPSLEQPIFRSFEQHATINQKPTSLNKCYSRYF